MKVVAGVSPGEPGQIASCQNCHEFTQMNTDLDIRTIRNFFG